jgi:hypothetical protein
MTLCGGYIWAGDKLLTDVAKVLGRVTDTTDTVQFDPAGIG